MAAGGEPQTAQVEALFQAALQAGDSRAAARALLAGVADEQALAAVLRRPLPPSLLVELTLTPPWCDRPRLLARVALNPRATAPLALRVVGSLPWRDLAEVAATMRLAAAVRARAEALLRDLLPELRLGDRITLARLATPALLPLLLADAEPRVVAAALLNARLREEELVLALRAVDVRRALLEGAAASSRWAGSYAVRLALVLQPRTPLPLALHGLRGLVARDLCRVAGDIDLAPLVRAVARGLLEQPAD